MNTVIKICNLLESTNKKNIPVGLTLLENNPELRAEVESRYLNFIKARLNNPNATIFDFEQAVLTKEEIALFHTKTYIDKYCISLHYMENEQTKMIVDTIGSIFSLIIDIDSFKKKVALLSEENFGNKLYDIYRQEIPQKITAYKKKNKSISGWYSRIINKITQIDSLGKFYLDHTSFLDANESIMMEHFTLGLLIMSYNGGQLHIDVAQSDFPEFHPIFWTFQNYAGPRISTLDTEIILPSSFMSFVREIETKDDDFKPYQKTTSKFVTPTVTDEWLAKYPKIRKKFEAVNVSITTFSQIDIAIQKELILDLLETTDLEVFRLGLSFIDQNEVLADFINEHYKDLLKAHKSSKYVAQLFGPISTLINGNIHADKGFGYEEHSTFDIKYINALPDSLAQRLRYLSLDKNLIARLTAPLEKFNQVEYLIMQATKFVDKVIPEALSNWTQLKEVQITKAKLSEIPSWIANWKTVQKLSLEGNILTDLPKEIHDLEQLEVLHLGSNKFTDFPEVLTQISQLKHLDLSNSKFTVIPPEIGNLKQLMHLRLVKCKKIKDFTPIYQLQNLIELQLEYTGIKEISPDIGQLNQLKKLDLEQGKFKTLPKEIGLLSQLEELHLNDCKQLKELPKEIGQLNQLSIINLSSSHFSDYATILQLLPLQIQTLYLYSNALKELSEEVSRFSNLKILNLYNNQLIKIPKTIISLTALKELRISNNQLEEIPKEICNLPSLELLYVMENQLTALPEEIGNLPHIKEIAVRNNQIKNIPSSIGNLSSLENLYLQNNQIEELPEEIGLLTNLKKLYIGNNPIVKDKKKMKQLKKILPESCYLSDW